jgi:Tfp pilus assembly protein FimT
MPGSGRLETGRFRATQARGATVVELLTVLVLLVILAAIAIPNISPVVLRYRLRGAAWQLAGDLRLARQRAVTLQKRFRVCVTSCAIDVPVSSYSLERDDGTPSTPQWVSDTGAPVRVPPDVSVGASATATFATTGAASGATFTLTNLIGTYQVVIGSTGRVTVCQGSCP